MIGSRYIPGGGTTNWGTGRLLMSRAACLLSRPVTPVVDATSGFFLVRRRIIQGVTIEAGGFKICLELLVRGQATAIAEVPYVFAGRTVGDSKMNLREATGYLKQLLALWQYRRAHPVKRTYTRWRDTAPAVARQRRVVAVGPASRRTLTLTPACTDDPCRARVARRRVVCGPTAMVLAVPR